MVAGPLLAVLLFAGLGYVISRGASSSSSSAPTYAAPASSAAASSEASGFSGYKSAAGAPDRTPTFALSMSGTRYLAATLVSQVRTELAARHSTPAAVPAVPSASSPSSAPAASSSSASASSSGTAASGGSATASSNLHGCVLHFTKTPRLIDQATYQGTPAYVIADSTHVWVVGRSCTAQHQDLIASASLAG
jgi:hypothetical protein